jgi:hypothetical protein
VGGEVSGRREKQLIVLADASRRVVREYAENLPSFW